VKTILIIEDEPLMRRNLAIALQQCKFDVVEAADGHDGTELARTRQPDLIVCDVTMPGKDGYAVLRELRSDPKTSGIPFIFLTGKTERSDFRAGMNLGADDYLPKPVSRGDLLTAINARLHRQEADRAAASSFNQNPSQNDPESPVVLQTLGLTPREAEVLMWVAQGKTNPEIAIILGISHRTVKKHLERVFAKLGLETRTAATRIAMETMRV
jgi:DNA-binding NarL/FixJ family response regulator